MKELKYYDQEFIVEMIKQKCADNSLSVCRVLRRADISHTTFTFWLSKKCKPQIDTVSKILKAIDELVSQK